MPLVRLATSCRVLHSLLTVVMVLAANRIVAAQPAAPALQDESKAASEEATPVFDINAIDPETFQALAARLPEGMEPRIDGILDDEAWTLASPSGDFIQREPLYGAPSTERTEFRILYDASHIYFGIWAYDSNPEGILAPEMKRDSGLRRSDQIKIMIDTFHDHRNGVYFSTNPRGARKDAISAQEGRTFNYDWNVVWRCKTSIDGKGWYAEIAIPLSQLPFKSAIDSTTWGLHICRIIMRKNEETYWVPFPREWGATGFPRMSRAGQLTGLGGIRSRRRLELVPYLSPRFRRSYVADLDTKNDVGYGFDFRLGLTSDLNAVLTYKTDFAHVEADQEIVNLTRFSLFFPEKREFFTRTASVFEYGNTGTSFVGSAAADAGSAGLGGTLLNLFYSRRIGLYEGREVPILLGGKVTGRTGPYTLGIMNIETDETVFEPDLEGERFVPRANYTVLRVKRDILANSTIGAIFTNRQGGAGADYNRTAGLDVGFYLGSATKLTALLAKTFSPGVSGKDLAGALDFSWKDDRFDFGATYLDIGERFNAEMGFVPRRDIRNARGSAAWTPRPGWRGVRQLTIGGGADYYENHSGLMESRNQSGTFQMLFQDSSTIDIGGDHAYDFVPFDWDIGGGIVPTGAYRWNTFRASYQSNRARPVSGGGLFERGGYYGGQKQSYGFNLSVAPAGTLLIDANYTRNHITLPEQPSFATNTINTRISYSFTPDLYLKTFLQYNDGSRLANFNFLLWYIYRPGSDLYIVYNQGWDTDLLGPHSYRARDRSLTVKLTYWLSR